MQILHQQRHTEYRVRQLQDYAFSVKIIFSSSLNCHLEQLICVWAWVCHHKVNIIVRCHFANVTGPTQASCMNISNLFKVRQLENSFTEIYFFMMTQPFLKLLWGHLNIAMSKQEIYVEQWHSASTGLMFSLLSSTSLITIDSNWR